MSELKLEAKKANEDQVIIGFYDLPDAYRKPEILENFGLACYQILFYMGKSEVEELFLNAVNERENIKYEAKTTTRLTVTEERFVEYWNELKETYGKPTIHVVHMVLHEIKTNHRRYFI